MIDTHRTGWQDSEIAADAAADIEGPSESLPSQVPVIRRLHVQCSLPPDCLILAEPLRVISRFGTHIFTLVSRRSRGRRSGLVGLFALSNLRLPRVHRFDTKQ